MVGDYLKGLDRGFEQFENKFRYAEPLADRALEVLPLEQRVRPLFLWVHFKGRDGLKSIGWTQNYHVFKPVAILP